MRPDRIEKQATVLLDVIDCRRDPTLKDTYLSGTTVDISETGMKLLANLQIPVATRLGLRLDFHTHLYRLEGEVRGPRVRSIVWVCNLTLKSGLQ